MGIIFCLKKNARRFTDHFASPVMSVRVDFEEQTIDILFAKYWIRRLRCLRCLRRCLRWTGPGGCTGGAGCLGG